MPRKIASRFLDRAVDALADGDSTHRRRRLALQFLRLQLDEARSGRPAGNEKAVPDDTTSPRPDEPATTRDKANDA